MIVATILHFLLNKSVFFQVSLYSGNNKEPRISCSSELMIVAILATLIRLSIGALNLGLQRSTAHKKPGEEDQRGNLR